MFDVWALIEDPFSIYSDTFRFGAGRQAISDLLASATRVLATVESAMDVDSLRYDRRGP